MLHRCGRVAVSGLVSSPPGPFTAAVVGHHHHHLPSLPSMSSSSSLSSMGNSFSADSDLPIERAKKAAAFACGEAFIRSGQKVGVGSGSTVRYLVEYLKERYESGALKEIVFVPTSFMTRKWLIEAHLPVGSLDVYYDLDLCIDGADEVDGNLNCIKGGGGCLTQEKIVQTCAKKFIVIADVNKKSQNLGDYYKVIPIEVLPMAFAPVKHWIHRLLGGECHLRIATTKCFPLITDNNNYILEWNFPKNTEFDWKAVHQKIVSLPGVVETGLFFNVVDSAYFASADGSVEVVHRSSDW